MRQIEMVPNEDVLAWLRAQSGEYEYFRIRDCPLAKFFQQVRGMQEASFGYDIGYQEDGKIVGVSPEVAYAVREYPHTYEAAVERLETYKVGGLPPEALGWGQPEA